MAQRQVITEDDLAADPRAALDFFPTPPWATRALLQHVLHIDASKGRHLSCWEPCCGEGHMAEPLREVFGTVYASDVYPHGYGDVGSFVGAGGLDLGDIAQCPFRPDWIITNPPFSLAIEVARRALREARHGVALLLRTAWLESEDRYAFFTEAEPFRFAPFAERVAMTQFVWDPTAATATAYAWFVWSCPTWSAASGRPRFETQIIPPGRKLALSKPSDLRLATYQGARP
ncbi:hypothetical protein IP86_10915 [Rhodopseudomonas sp. AAP120]|nr:hypothetical protein IP86_10915 [Rhodopseudomonas sp. AAP120]